MDLATKVAALIFLAVALGVMLMLLPTFIPTGDAGVKALDKAEPLRGPLERPEPPAVLTATSIIVPGLIAGLLAFILAKKLSR
ncbi:MAG: hypothetical protein QXI81_00225 [Nitrososphaerota archaeon]